MDNSVSDIAQNTVAKAEFQPCVQVFATDFMLLIVVSGKEFSIQYSAFTNSIQAQYACSSLGLDPFIFRSEGCVCQMKYLFSAHCISVNEDGRHMSDFQHLYVI